MGLWRLSEISGSWEQYYSTLKKLPKNYKKLAAFVFEALPAFKRQGIKFVLDLGCGAGRHTVCLAKNDFDAIGVDVSKSALRIAKEWLKKENLEEVALAQATMTSIPFEDNQFDAVISVSVIHHAIKKDIEATINEVYRILKEMAYCWLISLRLKILDAGKARWWKQALLGCLRPSSRSGLKSFTTSSQRSRSPSCLPVFPRQK